MNLFIINSFFFSFFSFCLQARVCFCFSPVEILCHADPKERMTLDAVAKHAWVIGEEGPIPQYLCWCRRNILLREDPVGNGKSTLT